VKLIPSLIRVLRRGAIALGLVSLASPASAQWTRVLEIPAANVFSVRADANTIVAGTRTLVYVSTDAGATWHPSTPPTATNLPIQAVVIRNGRLYAGTAGAGVFVSDDLGLTWQAFNDGLVGGVLDSQLDVSDFAVRGDSLYAATLGAGVYVRNVAAVGTWHHFGEAFEPEQASNVRSLGTDGSHLVADAGGNGTVFFRDPSDADWTLSWLDNVGLRPGIQAFTVVWTGTGWVVGTGVGRGVFTSTRGREPWTFVDVGLGIVNSTALATRGHGVFGAFNRANDVVIGQSFDDGRSWDMLDLLPQAFVSQMAATPTHLYAARGDGLWRRSTPVASVPDRESRASLGFALVGAQPVGHVARLRFTMPAAGTASIDAFDVLGRRAGGLDEPALAAGTHEIAWNVNDLPPGVYAVRLTTGDRQQAVRLIHVR